MLAPSDLRYAPDEDFLPDILAPGLDVVFVGAAPSYYAADSGHYYAGPRNRFWLLLYQAGFTPRQLDAVEDGTVTAYGIGLTGLMKRVASSDNTVLPAPTEEQRSQLRDRLLRFAPRFICYNGKDVYRICTGQPDCAWGIQHDMLGPAAQYVVHSTSGRADGWGADRLYLFRELHGLIQASRCEAGMRVA